MTTALQIIEGAVSDLNRLAPGEVLDAETAAMCLKRLNRFIDELSAQAQFTFFDRLTSNAQTGHIVLGVAPWTGLDVGDDIVSATANNIPLSPITLQQFNELTAPTLQGLPSFYVADGLNTIYLWPVPNGQTIKVQTRETVAQFADYTTNYVIPHGWFAYLTAALAEKVAFNLLGQVPSFISSAARNAASAINVAKPRILDVDGFHPSISRARPRLF